jgi:hypothetical protein
MNMDTDRARDRATRYGQSHGHRQGKKIYTDMDYADFMLMVLISQENFLEGMVPHRNLF